MTSRLIRAVRLLAALLAVAALGMEALRWQQTSRFLDPAQRATGTVVSSNAAGSAVIAFPLLGREHRFTAFDIGPQPTDTSIPVAFITAPGQPVQARIDVSKALWSPTWTWVEIAFAALLAAGYGRALIEDPASVIGFRSARLFRRSGRE